MAMSTSTAPVSIGRRAGRAKIEAWAQEAPGIRTAPHPRSLAILAEASARLWAVEYNVFTRAANCFSIRSARRLFCCDRKMVTSARMPPAISAAWCRKDTAADDDDFPRGQRPGHAASRMPRPRAWCASGPRPQTLHRLRPATWLIGRRSGQGRLPSSVTVS